MYVTSYSTNREYLFFRHQEKVTKVVYILRYKEGLNKCWNIMNTYSLTMMQ